MATKQRARIVDVTIKLKRKDGRPASEEQARNALWAAQEIARKGGDVTELMKEWEIHAIDWRNTYRNGHYKDYHYNAEDISDVLAAMVGILRDVGKARLRVAPVTPRRKLK